MVVIAPSTPNLKTTTNLRSQSNPRRLPLLPSERDNNVAITGNIRRSKSREVNSRYLSTSSSSSTSGSSSSTISNSSYFSSNSRRCPSPNPSKTTNSSIPATPMTNSSAIKRSQSAERRRPSTPRARGERSDGEMSAAAKLLISSSKSLAVSFQGGSFSGNSSKKAAKNPLPSSVSSARKGAPEMKQNSSRTTPWPGRTRPPIVNSFSRSVDFGGCEGNKSVNGSATKVVRALQESLIDDCKSNGSLSKDEIVKGVRYDNSGCGILGSESVVSDRESVSSESNSGSQDSSSNGGSVRRSTGGSRMIVVPAKYWQEANNFRTKRVSEPGSPMARNSLSKGPVPPKLVASKRLVTDSTGASPRAPVGNRGISSPFRGSVRPSSPSQSGASLHPASPTKPGLSLRPSSPSTMGGSLRPASPSKIGGSLRPASPSKVMSSLRPASPSKGGASTRPSTPSKPGSALRSASPHKMGTSFGSEKASPSVGMGRIASPSRVRNAIAGAFANSANGMPSLCFGADVRKVRMADNRLGDAHLLRILHNRHLQWRFVNARAESSMYIQKVNAERNLYNAWKATSNLREAVSSKRKELQWLKQNLKLMSILKGQMSYLEEWAFMVKDHCSSLSGAMESLKASTLRLPLIGGAKADIQDVKDAICSAADVMHAMASSICSLLEKVEEVNSLMAEVASITSKEQYFLNQCKDILSMLAAMQVKDCSLRAHTLQLKCAPSILAVKV